MTSSQTQNKLTKEQITEYNRKLTENNEKRTALDSRLAYAKTSINAELASLTEELGVEVTLDNCKVHFKTAQAAIKQNLSETLGIPLAEVKVDKDTLKKYNDYHESSRQEVERVGSELTSLNLKIDADVSVLENLTQTERLLEGENLANLGAETIEKIDSVQLLIEQLSI